MMRIYLSPHFDDAAFSCGGLIWEQVQTGDQVSILTVCAGEPPPAPISNYAQSLHARWETGTNAVEVRKDENRLSCQVLGATPINLAIPDVIYRRSPVDGSPICASDADLTAELQAVEHPIIEALKDELIKNIPLDCEIISPLALGGHVDHRLVRSAVELLGRPVRYYADFPYSVDLDQSQIDLEMGMHHNLYPISNKGLETWQASIAAHCSQISTFWNSTDQMRKAVQAYWEPNRGLNLWYIP